MGVVLGDRFEGVDVALGAQPGQERGHHPDIGTDVGHDGVGSQPGLEQGGQIALVQAARPLEFADATGVGLAPGDGEGLSREGPKGHRLVCHRA